MDTRKDKALYAVLVKLRSLFSKENMSDVKECPVGVRKKCDINRYLRSWRRASVALNFMMAKRIHLAFIIQRARKR